jgi:PPK2 family polyphosphate:nucleotide phosphotransferase
MNDIFDNARRFAKPFRVDDGKDFKLKHFDPADTLEFDDEDKPAAKDALATGIRTLSDLQDVLYAQDRWALLLVFQAMDAAGKDSAIKHVTTGVNPQGCQVHSFKAPSAEELDHDYLWRCAMRLPERGRIGIFNRSYYEEVLVVRVQPGVLEQQKLPRALITEDIWKRRFEDIRNFESYLTHNGVVIRKFFLHLSKDEQKKRFLERIERPEKNWKFASRDIDSRVHWDAYQQAYEEAIANTATKDAPWFVVPADHKWFTRVVITAAIIDALASLDLHYPRVDADRLAELTAAKKTLDNER